MQSTTVINRENNVVKCLLNSKLGIMKFYSVLLDFRSFKLHNTYYITLNAIRISKNAFCVYTTSSALYIYMYK